MKGLRMPMTWTANRCLALLRSMDVGNRPIEQLLKRAQAVAEVRQSRKLGFRHLVTAQGIPWGGGPDADEIGVGPVQGVIDVTS